MNNLLPYIHVAGWIHLVILGANFFLPKRLDYPGNLGKLSTIMRQVFLVHHAYILLVLLAFAALCFGWAQDLLIPSPLATFLNCFLAVFWGARVLVQLFYYDRAMKRRHPWATAVLTTCFVYLAVVFAVMAGRAVL